MRLDKIVLMALVLGMGCGAGSRSASRVEYNPVRPENCAFTPEAVENCPPGIYANGLDFVIVACAEEGDDPMLHGSYVERDAVDRWDAEWADYDLAEDEVNLEMREIRRWRDNKGRLCLAYEFSRH